LVNDYNVEEINQYAELVHRGKPEFIEVKGVTYCGFTGSQPLTMSNVPFHKDVVDFCEKLVHAIGDDYELACQHGTSCSLLRSFPFSCSLEGLLDSELCVLVCASAKLLVCLEHSCCALIAHKKFKIDGTWHTWIDYDAFQTLVASKQPFTTMDYLARTPDWAVFGDDRKGFDPEETRFYRKTQKAKQES
jgi:tRNA wybutosine-synthesizing protein 1